MAEDQGTLFPLPSGVFSWLDMYKIKQSPEDFKVEEVIELEVKERGDYIYFWLTKSGYNTISLIRKIAKFLCTKEGRIGFAGTKDKIAVTKQAISIRDPNKSIGPETLKHFNSDRITLEYIGRGTSPISLGDNSGNAFKIIVESDQKPDQVDWFVNYFDDQRFSINNHTVGKAIIKKDWKTAAEETVHEEVQGHLKKIPADYVGAMRKLPLKIRLMYVHAFQSWLWNDAVMQYLQCKYKHFTERRYTVGKLLFPNIKPEPKKFKLTFPIVGFGTEYQDEDMRKAIKSLLEKHKLTERDFIVPSMPEMSCDGGQRKLFTKIENLSIQEKEKGKYLLSFFLPKGCYATMAIKRLFGD